MILKQKHDRRMFEAESEMPCLNSENGIDIDERRMRSNKKGGRKKATSTLGSMFFLSICTFANAVCFSSGVDALDDLLYTPGSNSYFDGRRARGVEKTSHWRHLERTPRSIEAQFSNLYFDPFQVSLSNSPYQLSAADIGDLIKMIEDTIQDYFEALDEEGTFDGMARFYYVYIRADYVYTKHVPDRTRQLRTPPSLSSSESTMRDERSSDEQPIDRQLSSGTTKITIQNALARFETTGNLVKPSMSDVMNWVETAIKGDGDLAPGLLPRILDPVKGIASLSDVHTVTYELSAGSTRSPTTRPSASPSASPTSVPTSVPSFQPTVTESDAPSMNPTPSPSLPPTTSSPTTLNATGTDGVEGPNASNKNPLIPTDPSIANVNRGTGGGGENSTLFGAVAGGVAFLVLGGVMYLRGRSRSSRGKGSKKAGKKTSDEWDDESNTNSDKNSNLGGQDDLGSDSGDSVDANANGMGAKGISFGALLAASAAARNAGRQQQFQRQHSDRGDGHPPSSPSSKTHSVLSCTSEYSEDLSSRAESSTLDDTSTAYSQFSAATKESFQKRAQAMHFVLRKDMLSVPEGTESGAEGDNTGLADLSGATRHVLPSTSEGCVLRPSHLTVKSVAKDIRRNASGEGSVISPSAVANNPHPYHNSSGHFSSARPGRIVQETIERRSRSPTLELSSTTEREDSDTGASFVNLEFEPPDFNPDVAWDPDDNDESEAGSDGFSQSPSVLASKKSLSDNKKQKNGDGGRKKNPAYRMDAVGILRPRSSSGSFANEEDAAHKPVTKDNRVRYKQRQADMAAGGGDLQII